MRYLWRLGGDSQFMKPATANAAVSPAGGNRGRAGIWQARGGDDQAGRCEAARVSASAGQYPVGPLPGSRTP